MKHLLLFLFLIVGVTTSTDNYVYICTGSYSKCYHKTDKCEGLEYCSKEIKKVTKEDAVNKYNRKPCKYCYSK
jgi:hypothetical protein